LSAQAPRGIVLIERVVERAQRASEAVSSDPEDAKSSGVVAVPALSMQSIGGFRKLLDERGNWSSVRAETRARDPFADHWIDSIGDGTWFPIDRTSLLMESTRAVLGDHAVRELGFARLSRAMDTGVLAPMLRSWARTVAPDTGTLVKLAPHLWRAISQGLGELKVLEVEPGFGRIRFTSQHPMFLGMRGWHLYLEGFSLGLVGLGRADAKSLADTEDTAEIALRGEHLELELRWRA
jgi:hypothetical protein